MSRVKGRPEIRFSGTFGVEIPTHSIACSLHFVCKICPLSQKNELYFCAYLSRH
ncbi:MAG: hypothetical protein PHR96_00530 [Clostridia bacterium]|nr:hypothetical protein [Clostridia bacterium]